MSNGGSSDGIERAMRRVVAVGEPGRSGTPGALVGSRRAILALLHDSAEPLTAEHIAARTGLHINTARHHLDVLVAGNLVARTQAAPHGRGRPKVLFALTRAAAQPFDDLEESLLSALGQASADEVAVETARHWRRTAPPVPPASTPDQAVTTLVDTINSVGFTAQADPLGESVVVTDCPYASLIADHPAICTIHAALVSSLLERTGQPVELERFDVWVKPGVCRAQLRRGDLAPEFVARPPRIAPEEDQ